MGYNYLDDLTVADVAFEATGRTLEETFQAAADATTNVMVADLATVAEKEKREIALEAGSADQLLHDFLQKIIYYKDAELLLLRVPKISIAREGGRLVLRAEARGEALDPGKHELVADVKAVTMHKFSVEETPEGWKATVILDI